MSNTVIVQPQPQKTFFDTVKSQLNKPLFAATLKHNAPGSYDFGYIDSSKYSGTLAYTTVDNSQGFWSFTADSYSVGGSGSGGSITGIADTGTTLLLLDDTVVSAYYSQVQGAQNSQSDGGYVFDCSTQLPDFSVTIAGYQAVVPGSLINFQPTIQGGSSCFGAIQSNQDWDSPFLGTSSSRRSMSSLMRAGPSWVLPRRLSLFL
jgi:aspergillopepsin I